jgi:DNA polymerase-3 subunit beta
MKLLEITRDLLLAPLQAVSGVVERRHTLPILSNVLVESQDGTVLFVATDLEIQISTRKAISEGQANFSITASARKLQDILRSLPENLPTVFESVNGKILLKSGKSRFTLQTLPAKDFPRMVAAGESQATVNVSQRVLKTLLSKVQYAMAQQDIRYYLNGLLMVLDYTGMTVVATDGHRLAYANDPLPVISSKVEVILPRKAIVELLKLLTDSDEQLHIDVLPNLVRFRLPDIELVTKIVDGKFPDYTRVIPTNYNKVLRLPRQVLLQALQRASILSNEKFRGVRWIVANNRLRIVCTNTENEEAEEELELTYSAEPLDIGFNITYLMDVLNNASSDDIECSLGDANSSMLICIPGDEQFKYVVMPMRI